MSWLRRHVGALAALVVLLPAAVLQATYGSAKFVKTQEALGVIEVSHGKTAQHKGGEVRLVRLWERKSLPSYGDETASHPPRTKFVLVRFHALAESKRAVRAWSSTKLVLRSEDGRTWSDETYLELANPAVKTSRFGGGLDQPWRPKRTYQVQQGFVVPEDAHDFSVDATVSGGGSAVTKLRFEA